MVGEEKSVPRANLYPYEDKSLILPEQVDAEYTESMVRCGTIHCAQALFVHYKLAQSVMMVARSPIVRGNSCCCVYVETSTMFLWPHFIFFFKLYIIVLVLPNIKMNPPQVYMCSPNHS